MLKFSRPLKQSNSTMTNNVTNAKREEVRKLLSKLFENTDANEISETLSNMLDCFILHSGSDNLTIANAVTLTNKISQASFNIEAALKIKDEGVFVSPSQNEVTKCLHN